MMMRNLAAISLALLGSTAVLNAMVQLHPLFSTGAVLQANVPVPIWGTGDDGEEVTVRIQDQKVSTRVKAGKWMLELRPLKAGGPFPLTIQGENRIEVNDVLVGEVWLCSGQSNMAFQLSRAENATEAIAGAKDSDLRFFSVPHQASDTPMTTVQAKWVQSTAESAATFSAVAYFFGRELRRVRGVPIGLIDSSVGGTPAEAWTSRETLEKDPELSRILESYAQSLKSYNPQRAKAAFEKATLTHKARAAEARARGEASPAMPRLAGNPAKTNKRPCGLYNAMIAPLRPFAIKGVIWYQGEGNANRWAEYQRLFPAMIQNWRSAWDNPTLPFLFVQIAPHERMIPEIREAQLLTAQRVPHTAMVVITDAGDARDIHPKRKQIVGERLALCARAIAYNEKVEYSGPTLREMTVDGNKVLLTFAHASGGLVAKGGPLRGFEVAGADHQFAPANAVIDGNKVIVSSGSVPKPVDVRYGWKSVPDLNMFNTVGLPASPFRTR